MLQYINIIDNDLRLKFRPSYLKYKMDFDR